MAKKRSVVFCAKILILCGAALACPPVVSAQLINGSFDEQGGSLIAWTAFNNVGPNVVAAPITPYDGTHVARVSGGLYGDPNYSGLFQSRPASGSQTWVARAQVRHSALDGLIGTPNSLTLRVEFYRVAGADYGSADLLDEVALLVLDADSDPDTWTLRTVLATSPPETVEARITFVFENSDQATGLVLIDDVTFEPYGGPPLCDLVWEDHFDGSELDPDNWEPMIGNGTLYGLPPGWGNNELQYYTDRPENVFVAGGVLHIVARQENYAGHNYTSARLRTRNLQDFIHGRMEARIKLPTGQGMWPAFWMMPTDNTYGGWAASGELDIIESRNIPTTAYGTIHFGGSWPNNVSSGGTYSDGTNYAQDFHDYAVEWETNEIRWYVDEVLYHVETSADWYSLGAPQILTAPFDQPFHFLLNVAVGGNFPGPPNGSTNWPQEMLVDWVRVTASPVANCSDGVACTDDFCDAVTGCFNVANDAYCDNGFFCDGVETCDPLLGCVPGSPPCDIEICDESGDTCDAAQCPADLDQDGFVNATDLAVLLGTWGDTNPCPPFAPGDLDHNCTTDAADLAILLGTWGSCE